MRFSDARSTRLKRREDLSGRVANRNGGFPFWLAIAPARPMRIVLGFYLEPTFSSSPTTTMGGRDEYRTTDGKRDSNRRRRYAGRICLQPMTRRTTVGASLPPPTLTGTVNLSTLIWPFASGVRRRRMRGEISKTLGPRRVPES